MKLEVIRGVVSDLHISQGEEDFVFTNADKSAGAGAAVGLAVGGLAGAATGAVYNSGDAADKLDFFVCRIGDENVKGRFGKVSFSDGDTVEAVGLMERGQFNAYAVTRPSDRTIWMYPHSTRGTQAYKRYSLKSIGLQSLLIPGILFALMDFFSSGPSMGLGFWLWLSISSGLLYAVILGVVARRFMKFAHIADDIFESLGFDNPADVDLPKLLRPTIKGLTNQECWNYHPQARWVFKY